MTITKFIPRIECTCMDRRTLTNVKGSLVRARDSFIAIAKSSRDSKIKSSSESVADELEAILDEFNKIKACE